MAKPKESKAYSGFYKIPGYSNYLINTKGDLFSLKSFRAVGLRRDGSLKTNISLSSNHKATTTTRTNLLKLAFGSIPKEYLNEHGSCLDIKQRENTRMAAKQRRHKPHDLDTRKLCELLDPGERSENHPIVLVPTNLLFRYYFLETLDHCDPYPNSTELPKAIADLLIDRGWDDIKQYGKQVLLIKRFCK